MSGKRALISLRLNTTTSQIYRNSPGRIAFAQGNLLPAASPVSQDRQLVSQADEAQRQGHFDKAIDLYEKALQINPDNTDIYLPIAKTYKFNFDYKNAIPYFEKAISINPDDIETRTLLGESYKFDKQYQKAKIEFQKILDKKPNYDFAKRNLLDTDNLIMAQFNPVGAKYARQQTAKRNLTEAVKLIYQFYPKSFLSKLKDVRVAFDKTAQMGGRSNIAQYEHNARKISVTDDYIYADPQLVAAYLAHEYIHAGDCDSYTSVREEQDAYRKQSQFWIENVKNVEDPEMDYVADLYRQSPDALDKRVEEIYTLRDKGIPMTSYNHPPTTNKIAAMIPLSKHVNSQPIKKYDIIV